MVLEAFGLLVMSKPWDPLICCAHDCYKNPL